MSNPSGSLTIIPTPRDRFQSSPTTHNLNTPNSVVVANPLTKTLLFAVNQVKQSAASPSRFFYKSAFLQTAPAAFFFRASRELPLLPHETLPSYSPSPVQTHITMATTLTPEGECFPI